MATDLRPDDHNNVERCQSSRNSYSRASGTGYVLSLASQEGTVADETAGDTEGNGQGAAAVGQGLGSDGYVVSYTVGTDNSLSTTDQPNVSLQKATTSKAKDKRSPKPNYVNKGKAQREKRKLREKRRSTGVVRLPSSENTGGSTGEEDEVLVSAETKQNTDYNESPLENVTSRQDSKDGGAASLRCAEEHRKSSSDFEHEEGNNGHAEKVKLETTMSKSLTFQELLQHYQIENKKLQNLVEVKENKIFELEQEVISLSQDLATSEIKNRKLQEENTALLHGMAKFKM